MSYSSVLSVHIRITVLKSLFISPAKHDYYYYFLIVPFHFFSLEYLFYRSSGQYQIFIDSDRSQNEPTCCQSTKVNAQCVILCCCGSLSKNNNKSWSLMLGSSIESWKFLSEWARKSANLFPHSLMSYPWIKWWFCWKYFGSFMCNTIYEIDQVVLEILYKKAIPLK